MLRTFIVIAALVTIVGATLATEGHFFRPLIGKIIESRCHMDFCSWFSIERSDFIGTGPKGELYRAQIKTWESNHPNATYGTIRDRKLTGTSEEYVFCSKNDPALIYFSDGNWTADMLFPDREDRVFGVNEGENRKYWALCHAVIVSDVYSDGPHLGSQLGYHTSPPTDETTISRQISRPEDSLHW